jgi:Ca2+-binding EF-hand superfamily protein
MKSYDGYNKIDKDEFLAGLRDLGVLLPKVAAEKLVKQFDQDIDGYIYIEEFLESLRGRPSPARMDLVDQAFDKFDLDNSNTVDVRDLK